MKLNKSLTQAGMFGACTLLMLLTSHPVSASPILEVPHKVFDFGERERGEKVKHRYILKNAGDEPLVISKVKPACGCTAAKLPNDTILPGQQVELDVTLNLYRQKGPQNRTISLESNDPKNPKLNLVIKGVATSRLEFRPSRARFGNIDGGRSENIAIDVEIESSLGVETFEVAATSTENLRGEVEIVEQGKHYRAHLSLLPPIEKGLFKGWIRFQTNLSGEYRTLGLAVTAIATGKMGELQVSPLVIEAPSQGNKAFSQRIVVGPGTRKQFKVTSVVPPSREIGVRVQKAGNGYMVFVKDIPPDPKLHGKVVTIRTDAAEMAEIRVPIKISGAGPLPATTQPANRSNRQPQSAGTAAATKRRAPSNVSVGDSLEISGPGLDGKPIDVQIFRNKPTIVVFWASWCGICKRELPGIRALYDKYHAQGLEIVGVNMDKKLDRLEQFMEQEQLPWPNIAYVNRESNAVEANPLARKYAIRGVPAIFVLDREGRVVETRARGKRLEAVIGSFFASETDEAS